jgi:glutamate dehydrogenase (NAD(P)+)
LQGLFWEEEQITAHLRRRMEKAFAAVSALAAERDVPLRKAAYLLAVSRVAEATRLRGRVG